MRGPMMGRASYMSASWSRVLHWMYASAMLDGWRVGGWL